jgi:hypothetical protein
MHKSGMALRRVWVLGRGQTWPVVREFVWCARMSGRTGRAGQAVESCRIWVSRIDIAIMNRKIGQ